MTMEPHESNSVGCFADGCLERSSINESRTATAPGWATQADRSRYACPEHVDDLRRLLGLPVGPQPQDA
jgi:hypothetical protein